MCCASGLVEPVKLLARKQRQCVAQVTIGRVENLSAFSEGVHVSPINRLQQAIPAR
jgi:hypothetical protein